VLVAVVQTVANTTEVLVTVSVSVSVAVSVGVDTVGGVVDPGEPEPSHFPNSA